MNERHCEPIIQHITDEIRAEHTRIRAKIHQSGPSPPRIDELSSCSNQPDRSTLVGLRDAAVMALRSHGNTQPGTLRTERH